MSDDEKLPPRVEQVSILAALARNYTGTCAFLPGDLLQPRNHTGVLTDDSPERDPWVVLEVLQNPALKKDGTRPNLRLATVMSKGVYVTWTEHWSWERYTGTGGTPGQLQ